MKIIKKTYNFISSLSKRKSTKYIILHHSASTMCSADDIHRIHQKSNGWSGIGYHFVVRKDGKIYEGRPIDTIGAHCIGKNSESIGVCFEGNFESEKMTDAQKEAGKYIVSYLRVMYPNAQVKQHKDFNATACAGKNFPYEEIKKGVQSMTLERAIEIVKIKAGLEQQTIDFMLCYKYGEELITKLAKALEGVI